MLGYLLTTLFGLWLLATVVAAVFIIYMFLNLPAPERQGDGYRLEGEEVTFTSADGTPLRGTFVGAQGRAEAPCVVFGHTFGADRHEAARSAGFLSEEGFHVFAFDFRGHGESRSDDGYLPERWVTSREREDVLAAVDYCARRPEVTQGAVGLFGLSRGANAALLGAALRPSVKAVVAESAFSTRELLKMHVRKRAPMYVPIPWLWSHFPDALFTSVTHVSMWAMKLLLGRRYLSVDRAASAHNSKPCFFIHGERDPYIDCSLARSLYAKAGEPKLLWIVPGARHNECLQVAPEAYRERVVGFLREHLEAGPC